MTNEEITSVITTALSDKKLLGERTAQLSNLFHQKYTYEQCGENFVTMLKNMKDFYDHNKNEDTVNGSSSFKGQYLEY